MHTTLLLAGMAVAIATIVWLVTRTCKEVRIADTIVCAENVDYRRLKPSVEPVDVVRPRYFGRTLFRRRNRPAVPAHRCPLDGARQRRRLTKTRSSIAASEEAWPSVCARQPPHREFDAVTRQHSPGFDLSHIGRLGKAAKQLARLLARGLPWQREGLAPKRASAVGRAASDIRWATGGHARNVTLDRARCETPPGLRRGDERWPRRSETPDPGSPAGGACPRRGSTTRQRGVEC